MTVSEARHALTAYRVGKGLSKRKAAKEIGVSHVQLGAWERGDQTPTLDYRDLIEKWSAGKIKATRWPLSPSELLRQKHIEKALGSEVD